MVVDGLAEEDDAVVQQAGIDVIAALAARGLLDNVGNESRSGTLDAHGKSLAFKKGAASRGREISVYFT